MKMKIKQFGIIAIVTVIGFAFIACDNDNEPELKTPTVDDFNISGLGTFTYDGTSKEVTITAKEGKTNGNISVNYNGFGLQPHNAGTYTVTFDVEDDHSGGYRKAVGISAGTLVINTTNSATYASGTWKIESIGEDIYIVGWYNKDSKDKSCYWKNGEKFDINFDIGDIRIYENISFSGGDVYIAGSYEKGDYLSACYWKNGEKINLADDYDYYSYASLINVIDSNVYVSGVLMDNISLSWIPCYWKNGVRINLSTGIIYGGFVHKSIDVLGSDVYVSGWYYGDSDLKNIYNCYWKNGEKVDLNLDNDIITGIAFSGWDAHIASVSSYNNYNVASYWKNGTKTNLSTFKSQASAIAILGSDVYIAGYYDDSDFFMPFNTIACYWKNGEKTDLSTNRYLRSVATGIVISGSDVYVSGDYYNGAFKTGCYWENGVKFDLSVE